LQKQWDQNGCDSVVAVFGKVVVGVGHFLEWQEQALKQVRLVGVVGQNVLGGFVD
jgi:hypothetical protein